MGPTAFEGCSGLTSITLPDSLNSIGYYAFTGCSSLTSITLPDSISAIGQGAFGGCSSLTSITLPDSLTEIGVVVFRGCSSLTSITLPDSLNSIGEATFRGCSSLTSITLPDSIVTIGENAFEGCSSLTSITLPDSITEIGDAVFFGCLSLESITAPLHLVTDLVNSGTPRDIINVSTLDGNGVGANGWTTTETPIGFVNVSLYPWIYVLNIDSFIYAEGLDFSNQGNWVYLAVLNFTLARYDFDANGWTTEETPIGYINLSFAPWIYILDINSFAYADQFYVRWIYLKN